MDTPQTHVHKSTHTVCMDTHHRCVHIVHTLTHVHSDEPSDLGGSRRLPPQGQCSLEVSTSHSSALKNPVPSPLLQDPVHYPSTHLTPSPATGPSAATPSPSSKSILGEATLKSLSLPCPWAPPSDSCSHFIHGRIDH